MPVTIEKEDRQFRATLSFSPKKGNNTTVVVPEDEFDLHVGQEIKVSYLDREYTLIFKTVIIKKSINGDLDIEIPDMVYVSFQKSIPNYKFDISEKANIFFDKTKEKGRIVDISMNGLSFICNGKYFEKDYFTDNAYIDVCEDFYCTISGKVKYISQNDDWQHKYKVVFKNLEYNTLEKIFEFITQKNYSNLKHLKDIDNGGINEILKEYNYEADFFLSEGCNDNSEINDMLFLGFSYNIDNKSLAFGAFQRLYKNTFLGNQVYCAKEVKFESKPWVEIYLALVEYLLFSANFKHLVLHIPYNEKWQWETMSDIEKIIGNKEHFFIDTMEKYLCDTQQLIESQDNIEYICEEMSNSEEFLNYCNSNLEPIINHAYYYSAYKFNLNELKSHYESKDFYLDRNLFCVRNEKETLAFAVAEVSSDISNIRLNNNCTIYFASDCLDKRHAVESLLPLIANYFNKFNKTEFNLLLGQIDCPADLNSISGVEYERELKRVIMERQ